MADDQAWPGDRGDWSSLNAELRQRINWARRRVLNETGVYITQVSGNRSTAEQIRLRKQNCGPSNYDIWTKPPSQCRPVTAIPGTSNHESGRASDLSPGPRSIPAANAAFRAAGLHFPVKSEDWHTELAPNRAPLPDVPPLDVPVPPPEEDDMAIPNDYLVSHNDGRIVLVNGVTNRWSLMANPDIVQYTKNIYALTGRTLEDHTSNPQGGTALIDFKIINEV